jgi:hypothetical protein
VELSVEKNAVIALHSGVSQCTQGVSLMMGVPIVPIGLNRKVVRDACIEGCLEQHFLHCTSSSTRTKSQCLRLALWQGRWIGAERSTGLQRPHMAGKVVRFNEHKLILVAVVERLRWVLLNAEVQGCDTLNGRVGAIVGAGEQLSTTETVLTIATRCED